MMLYPSHESGHGMDQPNPTLFSLAFDGQYCSVGIELHVPYPRVEDLDVRLRDSMKLVD